MTDETIPAPRKRGRPRINPAELRDRNITFRTVNSLRTKLEAAAALAKRSVSEEVVYRLERSFDQEALVDELAKRLHGDT
jgi:hypothetical protein